MGEFLLEGGIGGLSGGEIAGLQGLAKLRKELVEGILRVGGILRCGGVSVMKVMRRGVCVLLVCTLLDVGVVLLGGGEVAGF